MEGGQETIEATLHVVWVHALGPPCAHFLLHASPSELEPGFVEVIAKAIRSGHPNQHRRRISHFPEPRLAFPQPFFSTLLSRDVSVDNVIRDLFARSRGNRDGENGDTNITPVFS